jgi:hypothetical protein
MIRRLLFGALVVAFLAPLAFAQAAAKEVSGTVKAVAADSFTVVDAGKDWVFAVDKDTTVLAKGASHKMAAMTREGKPPVLAEFLKEKASVTVKYEEKDGKLLATEVRVK